jgi:hypothetical protein
MKMRAFGIFLFIFTSCELSKADENVFAAREFVSLVMPNNVRHVDIVSFRSSY